jgi:hypothetical protein
LSQARFPAGLAFCASAVLELALKIGLTQKRQGEKQKILASLVSLREISLGIDAASPPLDRSESSFS